MLSKKQTNFIFFALIATTFLVSMTVTVTINMLPAIMADFYILPGSAQWLTSGATLVSGIMIPIAAYLIKRFPNKLYYVAAMIIFCVGSLLAGFAPSFNLLLVGRLIQAIGCGMIVPFAQIIIMSIYPQNKHGTVMSVFAVGAMVAPVVVPTISGIVIDTLGWRAMFIILFILGCIVVTLGCLLMRNVTKKYLVSFPLIPIILSSVGFCGVVIGIGNISIYPILRIQTGGAFLIGVISLFLFVKLQLTAETPFLNLRIFSNAKFRTSVIISVLMYLISVGSGTVLPVFAQSTLGYTATSYALATLPGSILMMFAVLSSGKIYDKHDEKPLIIGGLTVLAIGSFTGIFFSSETGIFHIGLTSCLLSIGMGCLNTPTTTMGMSGLDDKARIESSSILNTLRQIAGALASTLGILIFSLMGSLFDSIKAIKVVYIFYMGVALIAILVIIPWLKKGQKNTHNVQKR